MKKTQNFIFKKALVMLMAVMMGIGALVLFAVSLLQRKGSVRLQLCRLPRLVRLGLFVFLFFVVVWYGIPLSTETGGFLYAQF